MKARLSYGAAAALMQGSLLTSLQLGVIDIFSGEPPKYADNAATGRLLARITTGGLPWASGSPQNGLKYVTDGVYIRKTPLDRWVLKGLGSGRARWFRLRGAIHDNDAASLTAIRIDGDIAAQTANTDAHMVLPELVISPSTSIDINEFWFSIYY